MGIDSLRIYHGQDVQPPNTGYNWGEWRVDNSDSASFQRRDGIGCESELQLGGLWYIGAPRSFANNPDINDPAFRAWFETVQAWTQRIYQEGYTRSPGIALILQEYGSINGEIDPSQPFQIATGRQPTHAAGGISPYLINWLMGDDDLINFVTPPPPPDPE